LLQGQIKDIIIRREAAGSLMLTRVVTGFGLRSTMLRLRNVHSTAREAAKVARAYTMQDTEVFYLFLQKQKIGSKLHIYL
jgi:hypothetical protein